MKCLRCKIDMECKDDMVLEFYRADYFKCPKCGAESLVEYDPHTMEILKANWKGPGQE